MADVFNRLTAAHSDWAGIRELSDGGEWCVRLESSCPVLWYTRRQLWSIPAHAVVGRFRREEGMGGGPKFTAVAQSPESIWPLAMGGRRSHRTPFLRGRVIWAPEIYCHGENFTQVDFGGRRLPVRFVFIADWDEPDPGSKLILRIRNRGPRWLALDPLPVARLQGS